MYSSLPTGCGEGISGPDETKVKYEEVTGSRNKHVCILACRQLDITLCGRDKVIPMCSHTKLKIHFNMMVVMKLQ